MYHNPTQAPLLRAINTNVPTKQASGFSSSAMQKGRPTAHPNHQAHVGSQRLVVSGDIQTTGTNSQAGHQQPLVITTSFETTRVSDARNKPAQLWAPEGRWQDLQEQGETFSYNSPAPRTLLSANYDSQQNEAEFNGPGEQAWAPSYIGGNTYYMPSFGQPRAQGFHDLTDQTDTYRQDFEVSAPNAGTNFEHFHHYPILPNATSAAPQPSQPAHAGSAGPEWAAPLHYSPAKQGRPYSEPFFPHHGGTFAEGHDDRTPISLDDEACSPLEPPDYLYPVRSDSASPMRGAFSDTSAEPSRSPSGTPAAPSRIAASASPTFCASPGVDCIRSSSRSSLNERKEICPTCSKSIRVNPNGKSKSNFHRHVRSKHHDDSALIKVSCSNELFGCKRTFSRRDNMKMHIKLGRCRFHQV